MDKYPRSTILNDNGYYTIPILIITLILSGKLFFATKSYLQFALKLEFTSNYMILFEKETKFDYTFYEYFPNKGGLPSMILSGKLTSWIIEQHV